MNKINIFRDDKTKIKILSYLLIFIALYGVNNTYIYYADLTPFGVGFLLSLIMIGYNGYLLSILYILANIVNILSISIIVQTLNVIIVFTIIQWLIDNRNYKVKTWHMHIYAVLSEISFIIFSLGSIQENLALFVSIILGQIFLYVCMNFFRATFGRSMMVKLNIDEKISGAILLLIFIIGMSACNIGIINFGLIFVSLIILITTFVCSGSVSILIASLMGVGFSISYMSPVYISMFVFIDLIAIAFKCNFKYLSSISVIVSYILFSLFFDIGLSLGEILSVIAGIMIFIFVPMKILDHVAGMFMVKTRVLSNDIINKSKQLIIKRVRELSTVFSEMDGVYRDMVKGVLCDDQAKTMLKEELIASQCAKCENKNICFRANGDYLEKSINALVDIAYEKGKILLIDLPQFLTSNCIKVNQLILNLNNMINSYKEYSGAVTNLDTSRLLIADQLSGVSCLLETLSKEVDININYDCRYQRRIMEDLNYKGIICLDCAVYEQDINNKFVNLIIKSDTIDKKKIEKCVSKIIGSKMIIKSIDNSEIHDTNVVSLIRSPNYDIVFGSATLTKSGLKVSGDCHGIIKISESKYMVSICDGMGSGDRAHDISSLTLNLIENFYRAGFDNEIILNSINKLLSLSEMEHFSTIDLCVIDTQSNIYDFVKLGASNGYLKHNNGQVEIIESNGLPVGVLEEITPHITRKLINPYDMLIFVSDGIGDCFESNLDMREFLSNINNVNPQGMSEAIMQKALELSQNIAKDDMTVVCVRIIENV